MVAPVNIHEAKTQLSKLIERVEAGEEVVIARAGKPVARLVAFQTPKREPRRPGMWKGKVELKEGWDEPLPDEIIDAFCNSKIFPDESDQT